VALVFERFVMMNKVILSTFLFLNSILILAQETQRDIIKIDKEEFLKKELYGKMRTVVVNKYVFIDTILASKPSKKSIFTFSNNLDLIKIEYIDYNKNDNTVYFQEYDNKHNIIKEYDNRFKDTSYYFYDNHNRLITKKSAIYDTLITTLKQIYDSLGRLIEKYQYHLTSKYSYENDNKNFTSAKVYNRHGKLIQSTSFDYDFEGNCIKEIRTTYDGDSISKSQIEYKFEKSKLICLKNSWAGEFLTFYDDVGSIIKTIYPNRDVYENKIVYDSYMNEEKVTKYKNGKNFEYDEYYYSYFK
jgi:hypothetical protein